MPLLPEINFDDIIVAEKYINGYDYERCKNGLWSIYNIIKKIANVSHPRVSECLLMIGVNAKCENDGMMSLVYSGKMSKKYKRGMPSAQYLFELEKFGFVFYDIVTAKEETPKNKLSIKDIEQFSILYNSGDFSDVIFGLKLFSDICVNQSSPLACFLARDIRVAFSEAPKLYAPPVEELFYFLPEEQKKAAFAIHEKLEEMGCVRELEGENAVKYKHAKHKGQVIATIWAGENLWFLPESEKEQKVVFKFNLRNIGKYSDYLNECTEAVQKSIFETDSCGLADNKTGMCGNGHRCGGVVFEYKGKTSIKCTRYFCIFKDLSKRAIENYIKLIELENKELQIKKQSHNA
ncbi:MAG: hypothetical protein A2Y17_11140 [Clostridiales bacterium GWF2_38_85]|nr:MAG: hypothetical protein A2Y17_11140 [Clostridiales bacterium GWF2_38_85]HBL84680.1 hypothetical protein [Clostridiales bacterium]